MKAQKGTAPLILNPGTGCMPVFSITLYQLYLQERTPVPI